MVWVRFVVMFVGFLIAAVVLHQERRPSTALFELSSVGGGDHHAEAFRSRGLLALSLATQSRPRRSPGAGARGDRPINGRVRVAANLLRLRKRQELSQEDVADLAGVHRTYVGSIERAERNVSIDNVCRLAWALGVDPKELFSAT